MFIPSELSGEPLQIAFSLKFIQDFLSAVSSEKVGLEMTTPSYPGLFKPVGDSPYQYVLMPISML